MDVFNIVLVAMVICLAILYACEYGSRRAWKAYAEHLKEYRDSWRAECQQAYDERDAWRKKCGEMLSGVDDD